MLDLYQGNKNKVEVPDSPPQMPPSKASITKIEPPNKKIKLQQSPNVNPKSGGGNHIPVKVLFYQIND